MHPAFRGCSNVDSLSPNRNCGIVTPNGQSSMEIDQITSLVSIFSFGQHIMAAQQMAASSSTNPPITSLPSPIKSVASPSLSTVASSCLSSSLSESKTQLISPKKGTNEDSNGDEKEIDISKDHPSETIPRRIRRRGREKKNTTNENTASAEGSDSESDTSSDSGHSSDDHDNSSEDKSSDTADDKSDEDISANESLGEENEQESECGDMLLTKIGKRSLSSSPSSTSDSFSCGGEKTKTSSTTTVHSEACVQVASV